MFHRRISTETQAQAQITVMSTPGTNAAFLSSRYQARAAVARKALSKKITA
jgi:hypothetical protein